MENNRWAYLFETGRLAWSKLRIDPKKLAQMKERKIMMDNLKRQGQRYGVSKLVTSQNAVSSDLITTDIEKRDEHSSGSRGLNQLKKITSGTDQASIQKICNRIRYNLDVIKTAANSLNDFFPYLDAELYGTKSKGTEDEQTWDEGDDVLEELQDVLGLELDVVKKKKTANNAEYANLLQTERNIREDRVKLIKEFAVFVHRKEMLDQGENSDIASIDATGPETLTAAQNSALDKFREVTGFDEARSLRFLKKHDWDVETAVSTCLDERSSPPSGDAETQDEDADLARAIQMSLEDQVEEAEPPGCPKEDDKGKGRAEVMEPEKPAVKKVANVNRWSPPPGYGPGPSRKRKHQEVEDTPEDLAAARARLARIIEEANAVGKPRSPPKAMNATPVTIPMRGKPEIEKILNEELVKIQLEMHRQLTSLITLSDEERALIISSIEEQSRAARQTVLGSDSTKNITTPSVVPEPADPPSPRTTTRDIPTPATPAQEPSNEETQEEHVHIRQSIESTRSTSSRERPSWQIAMNVINKTQNKRPRLSGTSPVSDPESKAKEGAPSPSRPVAISPAKRGRNAIKRVVESEPVRKSPRLAARAASVKASAGVTEQVESPVARRRKSSGVKKRAGSQSANESAEAQVDVDAVWRHLVTKVDERRDSMQDSRKGSDDQRGSDGPKGKEGQNTSKDEKA